MSVSIGHAIDIAIQTFAALYAGTSVKSLVLVLSLLLCFGGCRLMRWSSALYGVVGGVALGICVTGLIPVGPSLVNGLIQNVLAVVIGGIVVGILAFRFKELGIFLICACIGAVVAYVPATFIQQLSSIGFWFVIVVCAMLFGITGVLFLKPAYLLVTGLSGIPAGFALTGLLGVSSIGIGFLLGCGLTIAGCVVQWFLLRRMEERTELALQHTVANLPIVSEEEDDIDRISSRIAEHIGMTDSYQTTDFLSSDEPETVDDRTMMIPEMEKTVMPQSDGMTAVKKSQEQKEVLNKTPQQPAADENAATMSEVLGRFASVTPEDASETEQQPPAIEAGTELDGADKSSEWSSQTADSVEETPQEAASEQCVETMETASYKHKPIEIKQMSRWIIPTFLIAAALFFVQTGMAYIEILLTLCFVGYVLRHYRSVAFVCAVLCVRRAVDVFDLFVQQAHWISVALSAVSCLCFLILTIAALRTVFGTSYTTEK